jgi:hypothetical protein
MPPSGSRKIDPVWIHATQTANPSSISNPRVTCNYCSFHWTSNAVIRVRDHLRKCPSLPIEYYAEFAPQRQKQTISHDLNDILPTRKRPRIDTWFASISPEETEKLHLLLAEWIDGAGLPLSLVYSSIQLLLTTLICRLQILSDDLQKALQSGGGVQTSQRSPCTFIETVGPKSIPIAFHFPAPVTRMKSKTRIARILNPSATGETTSMGANRKHNCFHGISYQRTNLKERSGDQHWAETLSCIGSPDGVINLWINEQ